MKIHHGTRGGRPDARLLGGWFIFDSPATTLLVSLLPSLVHVRGVERLSLLVRVGGEDFGSSAYRGRIRRLPAQPSVRIRLGAGRRRSHDPGELPDRMAIVNAAVHCVSRRRERISDEHP